MADWIIQPYSDQHRPQVIKLFDVFQGAIAALDPLGRLQRRDGYGRQALEQTLQQLVQTQGLFLVALQEEQVIGFVVGVVEQLPAEASLGLVPTRPGRILELFVDEAYRGHGLGSQLMQAAEEHLIKLGCDVIKVEVFGPNDQALRLYQRLGYQVRDLDLMKQVQP